MFICGVYWLVSAICRLPDINSNQSRENGNWVGKSYVKRNGDLDVDKHAILWAKAINPDATLIGVSYIFKKNRIGGIECFMSAMMGVLCCLIHIFFFYFFCQYV